MTRRVVVTGVGLVTPLAATTRSSWSLLLRGKSGISKITRFDVSDLPAQIAGVVPDDFESNLYMEAKEQKRVDRFVILAVCAAVQAIEDSGWTPVNDEDCERTGVLIGSGIGGLPKICETSIALEQKGPRQVSPFFIPASLINIASGAVSIRYGFKGPNHSVVTACATGTHAIGDAARLIMFGDADVMIAGGSEAAVARVGIAGFAAAKALSTSYNATPELASRPWDKGRDGFVMGEGAGIVVLEEYEHAKARGARIYAEVIGYGLSGDAHHVTAPPEDGQGAARAMKAALRNAKINPETIDYINAHGTSTPPGDRAEVFAVKSVFGDHAYKLAISSTKSSIGHLLGAAGSVEAIFSILAMQENVCPPTLNLHAPDDGCDLNFVPLVAQERPLHKVMSNSFGFGGTNASLIFQKV